MGTQSCTVEVIPVSAGPEVAAKSAVSVSYADNPAFDTHEVVEVVRDRASGLHAIIALHSTIRGPAGGGCRMWPYGSEEEATTDVLRLSRGMSFKNAIADVPLGGGKAVIIGDPRRDKSVALFEAFGRAVDRLAGRYIAAEDVGVTTADIAHVASQTRYVAGLPRPRKPGSPSGDTSRPTAKGVVIGIRTCLRRLRGADDLDGITVAVQGLGGVGYRVCRELFDGGADLIVADLDVAAVERVCDEFGATPVAVDEILFQSADVLAPCALGGILNEATIPRLQVRIVAGAANNQLLRDEDGARLHERGILYAPDYVINAGGVINAAAEYLGSMSEDGVLRRIDRIGETLALILDRAARKGRPTSETADEMARAILRRDARAVASVP
jgi:leucine dehydrogenase